MKHTLNEFVDQAQGLNLRVAVASAHDTEVIEALLAAREKGICSALLFGKAQQIHQIFTSLGADETGQASDGAKREG